jgi:hypothetical protein
MIFYVSESLKAFFELNFFGFLHFQVPLILYGFLMGSKSNVTN